MILVCYDASEDARAAIRRAATLMPGAEATVVTVWEPFLDVMIGSSSIGMATAPLSLSTDPEELDSVAATTAADHAEAGAELARDAGLDATSRAVRAPRGVAQALLATASELEADAIVLGTRGRTGVRSYLLGSVSHTVLQHADRAVLVIPSDAVAATRHDWVAAAAAGLQRA